MLILPKKRRSFQKGPTLTRTLVLPMSLTTSPTYDPGSCKSWSSSRNMRTFALSSFRIASSRRRFFTFSDTTTCSGHSGGNCQRVLPTLRGRATGIATHSKCTARQCFRLGVPMASPQIPPCNTAQVSPPSSHKHENPDPSPTRGQDTGLARCSGKTYLQCLDFTIVVRLDAFLVQAHRGINILLDKRKEREKRLLMVKSWTAAITWRGKGGGGRLPTPVPILSTEARAPC